jgi:hypothetical protein
MIAIEVTEAMKELHSMQLAQPTNIFMQYSFDLRFNITFHLSAGLAMIFLTRCFICLFIIIFISMFGLLTNIKLLKPQKSRTD